MTMTAFRPLLLLAVVASATSAGYEQPPLPYKSSALEPMISRKTLEIHHGKHHAKYVNTMNEMIKGTWLENQSLERIMNEAHHNNKDVALYNNAAQAWNHAFYWNCMKPKGGGEPPAGRLMDRIVASFGSYAEFRKQFAEAANTAFGSGWAWLVCSRTGRLSVVKTIGADNPAQHTKMGWPIMTIDVWEHAYYLDYQNKRPDYVDTFLDKLVNWEYVAENLDRVMDSGRGAEL